jgi:3-isopropylmalate/(R)-2-methylmalate dehydratase large subunit
VRDVLASQTLALSPSKVRRIINGRLGPGVRERRHPDDHRWLGVQAGAGYAYEYGEVLDRCPWTNA